MKSLFERGGDVPWFNDNESTETPYGVLEAAIKRDVCGRLEQAMHDDAVIAEYLAHGPATVVLDVVVEPDLGAGELSFETGNLDDEPLAPSIGQPAVAAVVTLIRERILDRQAMGERLSDEPMRFEIAVQPDVSAWRSA
jgi:hypothetical protein